MRRTPVHFRGVVTAALGSALLVISGARLRAQTSVLGGGADSPSPVDLAELTPPDYAEEQELRKDAPVRPRFYLGSDVVTQYISRGLVFSDKPSVQPWFEAVAPLPSLNGNAADPRLSLFAGTWNSFHNGASQPNRARTGRLSIQENWYESDVYGGFRFKPTRALQTSVRFNSYSSPSDSFRNIQEIDFRVTYSDGSFWKEVFNWNDFNFGPSLRVAKETSDDGGPEQWYVQPSVTPSFSIPVISSQFRLKFPLVLGFGAGGQYIERDTGSEHHWGFMRLGIGFEVPITGLHNNVNPINLSAGFHAVILADRELSLVGERVESFARIGIAYSF